jgi:hypothetical protein
LNVNASSFRPNPKASAFSPVTNPCNNILLSLCLLSLLLIRFRPIRVLPLLHRSPNLLKVSVSDMFCSRSLILTVYRAGSDSAQPILRSPDKERDPGQHQGRL